MTTKNKLKYSRLDKMKEQRAILTTLTLLVVATTYVLTMTFKSCSEPVKRIKKKHALTDKQREAKEDLSDIKDTYSIDEHQLIQYKSDAFIHSASCIECLKRYR